MGTLRLTNALIRAYFAANGWKSTDGALEILGLRGCVPAGPGTVRLVENEPNEYNDTLCLYGTDAALYRGSVDPGRSWTLTPSHPDGCAHLLNGQPNGGHWYRFGTHRGHAALVQAAGVSIWRDKDRDGVRDASEAARHDQRIGLNIHAGGPYPNVDDYSAGCQIIHGGWDGHPWRDFFARVKRANQDRFRYTLCDAAGLADFAGTFR